MRNRIDFPSAVAIRLATVALLIPIFPGAGRAIGGASYHPSADVPVTQDEIQDGVDARLVMRWAELFSYVIAEFQADRRDLVGNVEADFSTKLLRVRKAEPKAESWASITLTDLELARTDLRAVARKLYAASKQRR